MKHSILRKLWVAIVSITLGCISWGCSQHDLDERVAPEQDGNSPTFMLTVNVPGLAEAQSRAISETDENALAQIDVLVFRVQGATETFHYMTHATDISGTGAQRTFKVVLRTSDDGNDRHRFVVVANLRDELEAVVGSFTSSTTKSAVAAALRFSSASKWNTTSSSNFTPLPMWGESAGTHVVGSTLQTSHIGTIKLLRALARIDVGLNFSGDAPQGLGTTFLLSDTRVYNAKSQGLLVPNPSNYNLSTGVVSAPSVPSTATDNTLQYTHTPADHGMVREIYVAESANSPGLANNKMTCLVVGGYYAGSSTKTWYRIDFYERTNSPTATQSRLHILRNHRYKVNITSVDGPGYATPDIAFNSAPVNMQTDIIVWEEGDMSDIVFDGQYYLKVNMDSVFLYREGRAREIKVQTDHPNGWSISSPDAWIENDPQFAPANGNGALNFAASVYNAVPPAADFRRGYVTIKAGKLQKKILVHQTNEPELSINVEPTSLTFRKTGSNPKTITVTTYPVSTPRFFSAQGNLAWTSPGTATGIPVDGLSQTTYAIRPPVNNTGNVLNSLLVVSVEGADGRVALKQVEIRQLATDLLFSYQTQNPYPAAGGTGLSFKVTSETAWNILSTLPAGIVTIPNTQHAAATDEVVPFDLAANPTWAQRSVALKATSSHPDFTEQDITLTQNFAAPSLSMSPSGSYDFALGTSPLGHLVTSNCNWQVKSVSGSYSPTLNVQQNTTINMNASPTTPNSKTILITPYQFAAKLNEAGTTTPAAGTRVSTVFRFTSTDHAPAAATTVDFTTHATVPVFYNTPEFWPLVSNIPATGATIDASLWSNSSWFLHNSLGQKVDVGAGNYAKRLVSLAVPANNSWQDRTVTFTIISTGTGVGVDLLQKHYQQKGYEITGRACDILNPCPARGANYTITANGYFPSLSVQVLVNGSVAWSGAIGLATPSTSSTAVISVPENTTTSTRNIIVRVLEGPNWITYANVTQEAIPFFKSPNGKFGWSTQTMNGIDLGPQATVQQLVDFCANSTWGGYSDWRIPTAVDLGGSNVDAGHSDNMNRMYYRIPSSRASQFMPTIVGEYFPGELIGITYYAYFGVIYPWGTNYVVGYYHYNDRDIGVTANVKIYGSYARTPSDIAITGSYSDWKTRSFRCVRNL